MSHDWSATTLFGSPLLMGDNRIPGLELPEEIKAIIPVIFKAADDFGLDYYETVVEWMTYDGISEVAAYDGFPQRYPHWRFGMAYEELSKGFEFGQFRIFEMVVNTRPCRIYCLDSNSFTDNVTVIGHALGHNHFFKNNIFFQKTNTRMLDEFGNNRTRIMQIMARWGEDAVESFLDDCLAVDTLIDPASAWNKSEYKDAVTYDEREWNFPRCLAVPEDHDYMEEWINPKSWVKEEWDRIKIEERKESLGIIEMYDRDIVKFLLENAPLKPWEQTVLGIIYEEAMYFFPQGISKTENEGCACVLPDTLIYTSGGMLKIKDIVDKKLSVEVFDGKDNKKITNWFSFSNKKTYKITTSRNYEIAGSDTHRILIAENSWKQLGDIKIGDKVTICGHPWFKSFVDEIVSVEKLENQTVYDITVEDTHRYAAQGFINHNSWVDFNLMARIGMPDCSIWSYSDHKARVLGGVDSMNPYKLGFELLMDIEERWNKGRFGKEYNDCKDGQLKEKWDLQLGLGHQKVFEVCERYNDVTLIAEFFTEDFCRKHNFYNWSKFPSVEQGIEAEYKIVDRDWKKSRKYLIQRHLNRGLPEIRLVDPNGKGKNILVLQHVWDGRPLHPKYTREALRSLSRIWKRPVAVLTKTEDEKDIIFYCSPDLNIVKELKRGEWLQM